VTRFERGRWLPPYLIVVLALVAMRDASAQTSAASERPVLGSTFAGETLGDLPSADDVYSILETTQAEVISDRFSGGGLSVGRPARVGAFLNSWTQTQFRVGDVNVTIPDGRGAPFMVPTLSFWDRVTATTGAMPADLNAPGLAVTFLPRQPTATWTRTVDVSGAGSGLLASISTDGPPAIAQLASWLHGGFLVSGPLVPDRLGIVVAAAFNRATETERSFVSKTESRLASVFSNVVFTPRPGDEIRTVGWLQHASVPFAESTSYGQPLATEGSTSAHIESTWERRLASGSSWRLLGAYSDQSTTPDVALPASTAIERLTDGPVSNLIDTGARHDRRWSLGVRGALAPRVLDSVTQSVTAGLDISGATSRVSPGFTGTIGELVDGQRARMWTVTSPTIDAVRHETLVEGFVAYRIEASRLTLHATGRYDGTTGGADGASTSVTWHSLLPHVAADWTMASAGNLSLFASYGISADPLALGMLAVGDPAASTATVSRWTPDGVGPVVARTGPGTGGDPTFTAIDPSLARPTTREIVVGVESRPRPSLRVRLAGISKTERNLIGLVDTGAPASAYSLSAVVDSIADEEHPDAVQLLPVYNRLPQSFGNDRYLLTNSTDNVTFNGLSLDAEVSTDRVFVAFGATASQTEGPAANRGFRAVENDIAPVGELSTDPNAATFARGRLFLDRSYTIKLTTVYRAAHDIRLGVVARYQDGQPFSRVVVVPDLNQGAELIRAYPAGETTRFSYVGTLDLRLQKGFGVAGHRLDVVVDCYNVVNLGNEVEEHVVTGPGFRTITAVQPPRAVHLGIRTTF
jgi:hypothetical protein